VQRAWHIGGPATLRGYDFGAAAGQSFWTARGEVGVGFRIVRLVGFSDVGWAGHRDDLRAGAPLRSFGVGASFLDGVMRFDVARGNAPGGWKVHLRLDGVL
jgi:hemolysin activation/secretion protein